MNSAATQISRGDRVSRPTREILRQYIIDGQKVLHFGAGKAHTDSAAMLESGADSVTEYDPNSPFTASRDRELLNDAYDIVICNYVLNVVPPFERGKVISEISSCAYRAAYISVRSNADKSIVGEPIYDGVLTSRGTFQKAYTVESLKVELSLFFRSVVIIHKAGGTIIAKCS